MEESYCLLMPDSDYLYGIRDEMMTDDYDYRVVEIVHCTHQ